MSWERDTNGHIPPEQILPLIQCIYEKIHEHSCIVYSYNNRSRSFCLIQTYCCSKHILCIRCHSIGKGHSMITTVKKHTKSTDRKSNRNSIWYFIQDIWCSHNTNTDSHNKNRKNRICGRYTNWWHHRIIQHTNTTIYKIKNTNIISSFVSNKPRYEYSKQLWNACRYHSYE